MTTLARTTPEAGRRGPAARPPAVPRQFLLAVAALMALGLVIVFSASRSVDPAACRSTFDRHIVYLGVAALAAAVGMVLPYRLLNRWWTAVPVLAVVVALLVGVLFFGVERNHVMRWYEVPIGGGATVSFQPSEVAKIALAVFLAWYFARPRTDPKRILGGFAVPMAAVGAVTLLIAKEDFGTGALVGLVGTLVCVIAGCRLRHLALLVPPATFVLYWWVWMVPFRRDRLLAFLDPWAHQEGAGWHVGQSLMGIGCGGLFGRGLGEGVQKYYIPESDSDFVFAVLCEEMGVLGGILILGLFAFLVWQAGRIVARARDRFAYLLACGLVLTIGLQAVINVGVVTGSLPAKGIPLPFISCGGSGLLAMGMAAGLLAGIGWRSARADAGAAPLVRRPREAM